MVLCSRCSALTATPTTAAPARNGAAPERCRPGTASWLCPKGGSEARDTAAPPNRRADHRAVSASIWDVSACASLYFCLLRRLQRGYFRVTSDPARRSRLCGHVP